MRKLLKEYLSHKGNNEDVRAFSEMHSEVIESFVNDLWEKRHDHTHIQADTEFSESIDDPDYMPTDNTKLEYLVEEALVNRGKEISTSPNDLTGVNEQLALPPEEVILNDSPVNVPVIKIVLPNGKVNEKYRASLDLHYTGAVAIYKFKSDKLDELGLCLENKDRIISGIPLHAGEHNIELACLAESGRVLLKVRLLIIVNPDPKTLWKNIPTDSGVEYYKPDEASCCVPADGNNVAFSKSIVVASTRGRSHAHEGIPRDDDFHVCFDDKSEWYILAVADGAGSAKVSREGARIACIEAASFCKKQIASELELNTLVSDYFNATTDENKKKLGNVIYKIIGWAAFTVNGQIKKEASSKGRLAKDYASTLLLAICRKFEFGWFVAAFWVGDGGIGIYTKGKESSDVSSIKILGNPDGGEFAGQTRFITMDEMVVPEELYGRLRLEIVKDFTALILMTDGITDPKFETDANLFDLQWPPCAGHFSR